MKHKKNPELEWALTAASDKLCLDTGMTYHEFKLLKVKNISRMLNLHYTDGSLPFGVKANEAAIVSWATTRNSTVQMPGFVSADYRKNKPSAAAKDQGLLLSAVSQTVQYTRRKQKTVFEVANSDQFLHSFEWRQLRMQAILKYGVVCMCCGASPKTGAVINVDHIKPRKLFPHLALDINNLQILCHDCNHGKGNMDQTDWRKAA